MNAYWCSDNLDRITELLIPQSWITEEAQIGRVQGLRMQQLAVRRPQSPLLTDAAATSASHCTTCTVIHAC